MPEKEQPQNEVYEIAGKILAIQRSLEIARAEKRQEQIEILKEQLAKLKEQLKKLEEKA